MEQQNSSDSRVITVAIADDSHLYRASVKANLLKYKDIQMVAEAENGIQLLTFLERIPIDVVLLDIQMPVMDGVTTLLEIKKQYPQVKVIMLSLESDYTLLPKTRGSDAQACIKKDISYEEMHKTICAVYKYELSADKLTDTSSSNERPITDQGSSTFENVILTDKEITVLKLMCEEKSTKEIADIVELSPRTVEAIRDKLKTKTGAKSMVGLVIYAIKTGIVNIHQETVVA